MPDNQETINIKLFDISNINELENKWDTMPFNSGKWSHPHDDGGANLLGGAFNVDTGQLIVSLSGKAKVGKYGKPPMINSYTIKTKNKTDGNGNVGVL